MVKVAGGAGILALSFWITLTLLRMYQSGGSNGPIAVVEATYGRGCGGSATPARTPYEVKPGNATKSVADECNGKGRCELLLSASKIGDPAPGCAKDFFIQWRCGDAAAIRTAQLPAEALGKSVTLECPDQPT